MTGQLYSFGDFTLDARERRLARRGETLALEPKSFDLLLTMVRNAGRLVTKQELLDQVWPDAFVEEGILAVHISALRKALGVEARKFIETVPRAGYRFTVPVIERWSLAVLPAQPLPMGFSSTGHDLGLAIADRIIDCIGQLDQILVRPTSAVHRFTRSPADPAATGKLLGVDAVIHCCFATAADGVRLAAHLIRCSDGARLWSEDFAAPETDLAIVPAAIAKAIGVHLGLPSPIPAQTRPPSRSPEMYELFGRGRTHLLAASGAEVPKAIAAFKAALEIDPTYAAAHAGLALAYCAQAEFRVASHNEAYAQAKAAALRALAMDDSCADAQVALAAVLFVSDWNWIAAERSVKRALQINPNHTEAYLLYGRLLEALGQFDRAVEMKQKALERDPFSPMVHLQIAMAYWNQRQYDKSIDWANQALTLDPKNSLAREHLAGAHWKKGEYGKQMEESMKHAEANGVPPEALNDVKQAYAAGGRPGVVNYVLERAAQQKNGFPDVQLAIFNGEAGNRDTAFAHLERAIESHDPSLVYLAVGPQWDNLREDPRFANFLTRLGLFA